MTPIDRQAQLPLLDRCGRVWQWRPGPTHSRRYWHRFDVRSEYDIRTDYGPVVEVRDTRIVNVRINPTPADRVCLGHWIVLPDHGIAATVVAITEQHTPYMRYRVLYTDTSFRLRRAERAPVLIIDPYSLHQ
jgi:hypothetical protein